MRRWWSETLIAAKFAIPDLSSSSSARAEPFRTPTLLHIRQHVATCYVSTGRSCGRTPGNSVVSGLVFPFSLCFLLRCFTMATQVHSAVAVNGIKANGKIKSKNQLRRMKAKAKKAEEKVTKVCPTRSLRYYALEMLIYARFRRKRKTVLQTKT